MAGWQAEEEPLCVLSVCPPPPPPPCCWYLQPPHARQLQALPLGPGTGTGLTGFATLRAAGSWGRAGLRRQGCSVLALSPPPNPSLTSVPFSPISRKQRGPGEQKPLRLLSLALPVTQHVAMGKSLSLLGRQCLHLHSVALGSGILRPPHTTIPARALAFSLHPWASQVHRGPQVLNGQSEGHDPCSLPGGGDRIG